MGRNPKEHGWVSRESERVKGRKSVKVRQRAGSNCVNLGFSGPVSASEVSHQTETELGVICPQFPSAIG